MGSADFNHDGRVTKEELGKLFRDLEKKEKSEGNGNDKW